MKNICQACFLTHVQVINLQCKWTWGWVTKVFLLVQRGWAEKVCVAESCQSSFSCSERWFSQLFCSETLRITSGPQNAWLDAGVCRLPSSAADTWIAAFMWSCLPPCSLTSLFLSFTPISTVEMELGGGGPRKQDAWLDKEASFL